MILSLPILGETVDDYDKKIKDNSQQIQNLDKQIQNLKKQLKQSERAEKSLSRELDLTNQQISLTLQKISRQEKELKLRKQKRIRLQQDFGTATDRKSQLMDRYKKRVIRAYKLKGHRQAGLLLEAASPRQFYYRVKYLSAVNSADRQLYKAIIETMETIDTRQAELSREEKNIRGTVVSLKREKAKLETLQNEKSQQMKQVRSSKKELAKQVAEKEESKKKIQQVITQTQKDKANYLSRLEEERNKREIVQLPFASLKGKLPWPVRGKVIGKMGKHRHPVLGTITENSGIDIQSTENAAVKSVSDGVVIMVTWLRGFGNTIILMHDKNYYTVYSHVEGISVNKDDYVDMGQTIALVSDSDSMNGYILHFELWFQQGKIDPLTWLEK